MTTPKPAGKSAEDLMSEVLENIRKWGGMSSNFRRGPTPDTFSEYKLTYQVENTVSSKGPGVILRAELVNGVPAIRVVELPKP